MVETGARGCCHCRAFHHLSYHCHSWTVGVGYVIAYQAVAYSNENKQVLSVQVKHALEVLKMCVSQT